MIYKQVQHVDPPEDVTGAVVLGAVVVIGLGVVVSSIIQLMTAIIQSTAHWPHFTHQWP